ncbi:exonuclease 1 [Quercus suber]|uniref:Exonuclease 1 n=1 Tax=Quercus suber TaxID=58331 RepID=A0AAW0L241_QUESU
MGIKDLLRFMKPHIEPIHIKKYAGKRVGIDAYSWLHKGAYSCSMELCLNSDNNKKMRYIEYFMHRINLLRHHKITPVVVFDGGNIPCKAATEDDRHRHVGIDAYSWLHKGAYSCSMELCLNSDNNKKMRYIEYFMHRINLLRHHKITPVVVFDGGNIPCKAATEDDRHRHVSTFVFLSMF